MREKERKRKRVRKRERQRREGRKDDGNKIMKGGRGRARVRRKKQSNRDKRLVEKIEKTKREERGSERRKTDFKIKRDEQCEK